MQNIKKIIWKLFTVSFFGLCFLFTSSSFGQELPKPGEVINKTNIKKYSHLFPESYLPGIEDGWSGFVKPLEFKIVQTKSFPLPKWFMARSEQNRGKLSFDEKGWVVGDFDFSALPFPGVTPEDKDFATKLMWNYGYNYNGDDLLRNNGAYNRRRGEPVTWVHTQMNGCAFANRFYIDPKPFYKTPEKLYNSYYILYYSPSNLKYFQLLNYEYLDYSKPNDSYLYLPQMRRVLRGEAGQRSTPLAGTIQAMDDFEGGFDGKTQDFTYKYLGQQKMLGNFQGPASWEYSQKQIKADPDAIPFPADGWEVRDTYIIEVKAKDPKYPQSKKILYLDQETLRILYTTAWDRAGETWKIWNNVWKPLVLADGELLIASASQFGLDMQFGMAGNYFADLAVNTGLKYADMTPSAMIKRAR